MSPSSADRCSVLVVEDNEALRHTILDYAASLGCEAWQAANGLEALWIVKHHRPTLVLLDLTMPRLDGEQTMREIQAIKPDVRVVIMSGYDQQSLTERFAGLGPAGFLQKPFQPATLRKTLDQVLALRE